jgi:MoaA/NifB/PqqE/SkfB family radical SAM enzyme
MAIVTTESITDTSQSGVGLPRSELADWHGVDLRPYSEFVSHKGVPRPFVVFCETVSVCCNECVICSYRNVRKRRPAMTLETFERVVRDYDAMGGGILSLTPSSGEIFLDKHLVKRMRILEDFSSIRTSATTNAIPADLHSDDDLRLVLSRLSRIYVSFYGLDDDEYARMSGREHYRRALASVRRIVSLCDNPAKLAIGFRFLKPRPTDEIDRWVRRNIGEGFDYQAIDGGYHNWGGLVDTTRPLPVEVQWKEELRVEKVLPCLWPLIGARIKSDGTITLCLCFDIEVDHLAVGNIRTDRIIDAFNSPIAQHLMNFRAGMAPTCRRCNWYVPVTDIGHYDFYFRDPYRGIGG